MSTDLESIPTKFVTCNDICRTLVHNLLPIFMDALGSKQPTVLRLIPVPHTWGFLDYCSSFLAARPPHPHQDGILGPSRLHPELCQIGSLNNTHHRIENLRGYNDLPKNTTWGLAGALNWTVVFIYSILRSVCFCKRISWYFCGGSVAEWLGRRTWNPEVAGLSPALTT